MRFIYTQNFKRAFIAFLLVAAFVMADRLNYLSPLKSGVQKGLGGVSRSLGSGLAGARDFLAVIGTLSRLARENAQLNQRIDELSFENARLQSAKTENVALRRALAFRDSAEYQTIAAEVEVQDPTGFSRTVVLDKGEADGVILGQAVAVSPGLLAGRITKTYKATSEMTLVTDPSSTVNAEVSDSGARGLVRGEHGTSLTLDLVTQSEVIKPGDRIITSGLSGDYPRGLLLGEIIAIKSSASELFQQAFVAPAADLRNLRFVFIIK